MARFARVVAESKLLQLDRQFDFVIPGELAESIQFGHRVSFFIGRSKTKQTGFVVELLEASEYATSSLVEMKSVQKTMYPFLKMKTILKIMNFA